MSPYPIYSSIVFHADPFFHGIQITVDMSDPVASKSLSYIYIVLSCSSTCVCLGQDSTSPLELHSVCSLSLSHVRLASCLMHLPRLCWVLGVSLPPPMSPLPPPPPPIQSGPDIAPPLLFMLPSSPPLCSSYAIPPPPLKPRPLYTPLPLRSIPQLPPQNLARRRLWNDIQKHHPTAQLFVLREILLYKGGDFGGRDLWD